MLKKTYKKGEVKYAIEKMLKKKMTGRQISDAVGVSEMYVNIIKQKIRSEGGLERETVSPSVELPDIDPAKPAGPQYEALGVALLRDAARNGSRSQKIQASKELIRLAQRDKVPPPVSRKLRFVIETIDVLDDDKIHVVERQPIEVRL